jgi:hypothetical protein
LKALFALFTSSVLLQILAGLAGSTLGWVGAACSGLLMLGLWKGKEGIRNVLILFAVVNLPVSVPVFLIGLAHLGEAPVLAGALALGGLLAITQNGYCIWCLRQRDVQRWMFRRSMGSAA